MSEITGTQRRALKALADNGGEGIIDKSGHLLAAGVVLAADSNHPEQTPFGSVTWLRLLTLGELEVAGPLRLRLARKAAK